MPVDGMAQYFLLSWHLHEGVTLWHFVPLPRPPTTVGCTTCMPHSMASKQPLKKSKNHLECNAPDPRLVIKGPCQRKPSSHIQHAPLDTHTGGQQSQLKQIHFKDVPTPSNLNYHDSRSNNPSLTISLTDTKSLLLQEDLPIKAKPVASSKNRV